MRPWPLLIVTKSGIVHISDEQADVSGDGYKCRCGKELSSRNDHHSLTSSNCWTNDREPFDEFSTGEYKRFYKGGVKLCRNCGTAEDFDAAVDKYRLERDRWEDRQDDESRARAEIRGVLKTELSLIFDHLVEHELEEFPCANQERSEFDPPKLEIHIGEFKLVVEAENFWRLVDEKAAEAAEASTECESAPTECGGGQ